LFKKKTKNKHLKKKKKKKNLLKKKTYPRDAAGNFFCIKNIKKNKNLKILGLAATPDLRVIFIILIIKLNLHDPSLSDYSCNTGPKNTGCESGYKVVS
jgi:hypothetical protein